MHARTFWGAFLDFRFTTTLFTTTEATLMTIISLSDKFCTKPDPKFPLRSKLLSLRRPTNGQILRRTRKSLIDRGRPRNTFFAEIRERQLTASDEATPRTTKLSALQKRECAGCRYHLKPAEVGQTFCKTCRAWGCFFYHTQLASEYLRAIQ